VTMIGLQRASGDDQAQKPQTSTRSPHSVGRSYIRDSAEKRLKTLVDDLANPEKWPSLRSSYTSTRLRNLTIARLKQLENQTGTRSHDAAVTLLLESNPRENMILPGTARLVWRGDSPVSVVGPSGSGKTTFVKEKILPTATGPVLIVDVAAEYDQVKRVSLSEVIGLKWAKADASTRLRFCPNPSPQISKVELDMIFGYLNTTKQEHFQPGTFPSGTLAGWSFILEESHRLRHIESAIDFILEGRKFTRKVVTVSSDAGQFASVCRLVKPPPEDKRLL
jgi:hypothetical protein